MNRHPDHNKAQPIYDEGCHPALTQDAQVALPLREVCDLTTEEIVRPFLTTPFTLAQRIVRARNRMSDARISTCNSPYTRPQETTL